MTQIIVNGRRLNCAEGEYILDICRRNNINIPTLCQHDAVEPYGGCRLCVVEISNPKWPGWKRHVTSCLYPAEDGLVVQTNTKEVREIRAVLLDLLLARVPNAELIRKLAEEYGVTETSYIPRKEANDCILCGLCVRTCDEVIGCTAISASSRGVTKEISTPLKEAPPDCIGCGACAYVCPTSVIKVVQTQTHREIWDRTFEMLTCKECGRANITKDQRDWMIKRFNLPADYYDLCDFCKRKNVTSVQKTLARF
jgi:NADH dehydrogenase/NADH:ubiquinone oxidoreductase subunit G